MMEEVGGLELGDGLPEGKLQKPFYGVRMSESEMDLLEGSLGYPYIKFRARAYTKKKVLPIKGSLA